MLQGWQAFYSGRLDQRPDQEAAERVLAALVDLTGLTAIGVPLLHVDPDTASLEAIQLIAESHIALSAKGRDCAAIIFSCRYFDADACAEVLRTDLPGAWRLTEMNRRDFGGE